MEASLWTSKTGLDTQRRILENISHNLANVNTTGFKRGRASSVDLTYQAIRAPGGQENQNDINPTGIMMGRGARIDSITKNFEQGSMIQTGGATDIALDGQGFFQIRQADGSIAYSRSGNFTINAEGVIVTADGLPMEPSITIPANTTSILIGTDGSVSARVGNATIPTNVGTIEVATFMNEGGLEPIGNNLYLATAASGDPQTQTPGTEGAGNVRQGMLEASNVNIVEELVLLLQAQRAFEVTGKGIEAAKDIIDYTTRTIAS
ncbi:MAG: flagellar basal-body rod protein FlgG [Legionellales bacterium]|nr:flagellar basal-body rod protein FlgG [Legionellales bacterium]